MAAKSGGDIHHKRHAELTPFEREYKSVSARASQLRYERRIQGEAFKRHDVLLFHELRFLQMQEHAREQGYFVRRGSHKEEREERKARDEAILSAPPPPVDGFASWLAADDSAA